MVDNDVLQEAGAVRERPDAEVRGKRLPEIRERLARPDVVPAMWARALRTPRWHRVNMTGTYSRE